MCVKIAAMMRDLPVGFAIQMFDKHVIHALIGGNDLRRGRAELSVNLALTRGHSKF
jgi:hypothetical protein